MNPESVRIYARLTRHEYSTWVDRMLTVEHLDATRTTNLPTIDAADALQEWGDTPEKLTGALLNARQATAERARLAKRKHPPTSPPPPRGCASSPSCLRAHSPAPLPIAPANVGDLRHQFPLDLSRHVTYYDRPSLRRPPRAR